MAATKKKTAPKNTPAWPTGTRALATADDVALAAKLSPTMRATAPQVSRRMANLFLGSELAASLEANREAIDDHGVGTVADILGRRAGYVELFEAFQRVRESFIRMRAALTRDNAHFAALATAVAHLYTRAPERSPIKRDEALKRFVASRNVVLGMPKKARTLGKKARAKKKAAKSGA